MVVTTIKTNKNHTAVLVIEILQLVNNKTIFNLLVPVHYFRFELKAGELSRERVFDITSQGLWLSEGPLMV